MSEVNENNQLQTGMVPVTFPPEMFLKEGFFKELIFHSNQEDIQSAEFVELNTKL